MKYKVVPIAAHLADSARKNLMSPQYKSLRASTDVATGYGPCRSCLRTFRQGEEERIYLTYNSFEGLSDLPDPGPIFIHKETCERFNDDGFPPELVDLPLLFEAFGDDSALIKREKVDKENIDSQIAEVFDLPNVNFINIRNAEAGCFVAQIERAA